jgi:hypothetical protein
LRHSFFSEEKRANRNTEITLFLPRWFPSLDPVDADIAMAVTGTTTALSPTIDKNGRDILRRIEESSKKLVVLGTLYGEQELVDVAFDDFSARLDDLISISRHILKLPSAQIHERNIREKLQALDDAKRDVKATTRRLNDVSHLIQRCARI